jgi:diguanylate cyclase (GGDEF)-like protein/PAS domain S-box-containing protein
MLALSIAMTEAIVMMMERSLLGRVTPDYLWTGMVASLLVASLVGGVVLHFADRARRLALSLAESESKLRSLYELSPLGIVLTDMAGHHIEFNAAYREICGYPEAELRDLGFHTLTSPELAFEEADEIRKLESEGRYGPYEKEILRPDGSRLPVRVNGIVVECSGGRHHVWSIVEDISEQKRKDRLIWTQANYDVLTNLPNRRLLLDRMPMSMAASQRSGQHGALLLLDLDHFKTLNDTRGHGHGDKLLIEVARRLQACMREQDSVARLGGDEFAVVLEALSRGATEAAIQSEAVAEKIRGELSLPFLLEGVVHHISTSIGIVLFQGQNPGPEDLFSYADAAMYQAKHNGRDCISFHDPAMQATLEKRSALEKGLRQALSRDEFRLVYQLQIDNLGRSLGVEALIRWQHPELGAIPPAEFIPVAEETGLILPIGRWVLKTACRQIAEWQAIPALAELTVAINVSARQFQDEGFVDHVKMLIEASGIPATRLKLELTESMILDKVEQSIGKMQALKDHGVRFSLDDFGTCYSSLSYLKLLPLDQIKIDRSFVLDITRDPNDAAIVKAILALAQSLGLDTIAEGVETDAQREFLEQHGCLAYQGFLYSRPQPAEALERELVPSGLSGALAESYV